MKKLIGLILALCMLGTMASAAVIEDAAAVADTDTMTVTVTYTALADSAQATMLAYKVADTATVDDEATLAYVDELSTPIVGIDQEASDGEFVFKLASDFEGKVVIKVGGADVATPDVVLLADFVKEDETVTVTVLYGDVNGDGSVGSADALLIVQKAGSVITSFTHSGNGSTIPETVGDVNGDGSVGSADALLVVQKAGSVIAGFTSATTGEALTEYTYTYVPTATEE